MNTHYTYFLILAASVSGPLFLSFDKKVAFYKKWKYLLLSIPLPALLYIFWDFYFTAEGIWSFNEAYITGTRFVNLPIEEILFFFIVPYCCVFIYECIRCYFPQLKNRSNADIILQLMGVLLLITGILFYDKQYSFLTFIFTAGFIGIIYLFRRFFRSFDATSFLISFGVILIPFLLVNGFLTAIPVVIYNDAETWE